MLLGAQACLTAEARGWLATGSLEHRRQSTPRAGMMLREPSVAFVLGDNRVDLRERVRSLFWCS